MGKESQAEGAVGTKVWLTQPALREATATLTGQSQAMFGLLSCSTCILLLIGSALCWWISAHITGSKSVIEKPMMVEFLTFDTA